MARAVSAALFAAAALVAVPYPGQTAAPASRQQGNPPQPPDASDKRVL
jgi:hypothetical protein